MGPWLIHVGYYQVTDVHVFSSLLAGAEDNQRFFGQTSVNEYRDHSVSHTALLKRTVDVARADYCELQAVCLVVGEAQAVRRRFAGGVWAVGSELRRFAGSGCAVGTVNLAGAGVNEPASPSFRTASSTL